jgi:hypothetical protein
VGSSSVGMDGMVVAWAACHCNTPTAAAAEVDIVAAYAEEGIHDRGCDTSSEEDCRACRVACAHTSAQRAGHCSS